MKKALLAMSMMAMLSWTPAQAIDFYCEPEDDNTVSYSAFFYGATKLETTYIKLAPKSHQDEYWLRMSEISVRDKILDTIIINIDGSKYKIKSSIPDFDTSAVASVSYSVAGSEFMRTNIRFFKLTPEIVSKLRTAKKVYIIYSTYKIINQTALLKDSHLAVVNKAFSLEYEQYPEYWKPRNEGRKSDELPTHLTKNKNSPVSALSLD
ncbi:hypothetical protein [uncultured Megasphaera sp.]|jgi:hypothetical protein|uniref:hypothetical protein n=1 Tax=uncultured Megasphaera sp. TaxID=165188 RepID=UPI00266FB98F|nr:hypothetical protein [uncultured Megasphaera sp.]